MNVIYSITNVQEIDTQYGKKICLELTSKNKKIRVWAFPRLSKLFYFDQQEEGKEKKLKPDDQRLHKVMFETFAPTYGFYTQ